MATTTPAQLAQAYKATLQERINNAVKNDALGSLSRLWNETTLRGHTITTSLSFIDSAKGAPQPNPERDPATEGQDAINTIAGLPKLNPWFTQLKHQAALSLFTKDGTLNPGIRDQLEPAITTAYDKFGEESVNHQILVSYCLSFVFAQAVEAKSESFTPQFTDTDIILPGTLNAQSLITLALNHEANQQGQLKKLCHEAHQNKLEKLIQLYKYTQICAQNAHKSPQRFLFANRNLNIAIIEHVGLKQDYTADDLGKAYSDLADLAGTVSLSTKASNKISQLCNSLTDYTGSQEAMNNTKKMNEAVNAMHAAGIFMASATDSTPNPQAEPETRTHQEVKNYISKATSNLHKVWLADSRLGLLHFRFLENVNKVDRLTRKVTKLECKGASQEVILQQYLKLKTVTDRYVEKKQQKYSNGIFGKCRLPASLRLQEKINTKCAELGKAVHEKEFERYDRKTQAAIEQHQTTLRAAG